MTPLFLILIDGPPSGHPRGRRGHAPYETTQIAQSHDPHIGESLIYMAILKLISETQSCACNFVIAAI
jgi:hypothetical protein